MSNPSKLLCHVEWVKLNLCSFFCKGLRSFVLCAMISISNANATDSEMDRFFINVNKCDASTGGLRLLKIGSRRTEVELAMDVPFPKNFGFREIYTNGCSLQLKPPLPPVKYGTNYLLKIDGQNQRAIYLFFDEKDTVSIILLFPIQMYEIRQHDQRESGLESRTYGGALIIDRKGVSP